MVAGFQPRLGGIADAILSFNGSALAAAWEGISGFAGEAWQSVQDTATAGMETLQAGWDGIKHGATTALAGLGAQGRALLRGLEEQLQSVWGGLQGAWNGLTDGAPAALGRLTDLAFSGLNRLKRLGTSA